MSMNFIDIASWQGGMDLEQMFQSNPSLDGVIVKSTEGVGYVNPYCDGWAQTLKRLGKPWGFYHYCSGGDPIAEADYFYKNTQTYFGDGVPCSDYEAEALHAGTGYLKRFLDRIYELSGVRPLVYCSLSVVQSQNFDAIASAGYQLWIAQYANYEQVNGFHERPWQHGSVAPFNRYVMHQYTSNGRLNGWAKGLDFDQYNGSYAEWIETARGEVGPVPPSHGADPVVISEVLAGKYGIGEERVRLLREAGYDPTEVQNKINELYGIAQSCKKYTNGNEEYLNSIVKIIRSL